MLKTLGIFDDRKYEIELYYSILLDEDLGLQKVCTIDNSRFFKILKSNFILMLYNLVEACTVSGMLEIYESLQDSNCSYNKVIDEIKNIWANLQIEQIYGPTTQQVAYENRVRSIIDCVINNTPIVLTRDALRISGNLDAKKNKAVV